MLHHLDARYRSVFRNRHFAHGRHCGRAALESGPEELLDRIHVIRFHDVEQRVLGVGAITPDELETRYVGVEQRVRSPFVLGTGVWRVNLRDMEEHERLTWEQLTRIDGREIRRPSGSKWEALGALCAIAEPADLP